MVWGCQGGIQDRPPTIVFLTQGPESFQIDFLISSQAYGATLTRLDPKISDWIAAGLITGEQGAGIRAFEAARPGGNWLYYSFLGLAGGVIGLGVIALVATNWAEIPDAVKLGCDFALLMVLAWAVWRWLDAPGEGTAEILLLLFVLLVMASIGLISQVYHTGGELYQATLLWSGITLAAATLSRRGILPELWVTVALWSLVGVIVDNPWGPFFDAHPERWLATLFALPLACALIAHGLRGVAGAAGFVHGFRQWVLLGGLVAVFSVDFATLDSHRDMSVGVLVVGIALAMILGVGLWRVSSSPLRRLLGVVLIGIYVLLHLLVVLTPVGSWGSALLVITLFAVAALDAAARGESRLANLLVLFMGIRFLVLYFDAVGGLAYTGFGLIFTGLLILSMLLLWRRHRVVLHDWVERMAA